MSKGLKSREQLEQERQEALRYALGKFELPLNRLLLVYARQSSTKQVVSNVQSAKQQTVDLIDYGTELGWARDGNADYRLFVEKAVTRDGEIKGVSGTLRIDEREGLTEVVNLIKSGAAGAVLIVDISRLFRGEDLIDAAVFVKACKEIHTIVLTKDGESADVFDFNKPNNDDTTRFVNEAAAAAAFVKKHIRGKMLASRSRKARKEGLLGNGLAPVGMSVVQEEVGERGWRRLVGQRLIPSVHAPNVNDLYLRCEELGYDLTALHREVVGKPIFQDDDIIDPDSMFLTKVPGGWTVKSRAALRHILCSPVYAGHVVFDGRVVKRNAHQAIVDPVLWELVSSHFAKYDLEGVPYDRDRRIARYSRKGNGTLHKGLLSGVREDGKPVLVGTGGKHIYVQANSSKAGAAYTLKDYHAMDTGYYDAGISVPDLDAVFTEKLMEWLHTDAQANGQMYARFTELDEHAAADTTLVDDLEETRTELAKVQKRIDDVEDLMTREEKRAAYSRRNGLAKRLSEVEHAAAKQATMREELRAARQDLRNRHKWAKWDIERKRRFVRLVTSSVTLEEVAAGWFRLTVVWCPLVGWSKGDVAFIWRRAGDNWTEEETELLRAYYLKVTRGELLRLFPDRSWTAITNRWASLDIAGVRGRMRVDADLPEYMSLSDRDVLERYELRTDVPGQRVWWSCIGIDKEDGQTG